MVTGHTMYLVTIKINCELQYKSNPFWSPMSPPGTFGLGLGLSLAPGDCGTDWPRLRHHAPAPASAESPSQCQCQLLGGSAGPSTRRNLDKIIVFRPLL